MSSNENELSNTSSVSAPIAAAGSNGGNGGASGGNDLKLHNFKVEPDSLGLGTDDLLKSHMDGSDAFSLSPNNSSMVNVSTEYGKSKMMFYSNIGCQNLLATRFGIHPLIGRIVYSKLSKGKD